MRKMSVRADKTGFRALPFPLPCSPSDAATLVERVSNSAGLKRAPQLQAFLLYICQRALQEGVTDIGEHVIGVEVLGRHPDYHPNDDNIVRVQARHLRLKLQQYFENEGAGEPLILTIPKGSYLPQFEPRHAPAETPAPVVQAQSISRRRLILRLGAALALFGIVGVVCFRLGARSEALTHNEIRQPAVSDPLWSRVFDRSQRTNLVLADMSLILIEEILGKDLSLKDYLRPDYPEFLFQSSKTDLLQVLNLLRPRLQTSLGSALDGSRLVELGARLGAKPSLRFPRHLNAREFRTDNFVLLGGRRGIVWEELFEPQLNFTIQCDPGTGQCYMTNRSPQPGEPVDFRRNSEADVTYAHVALLPNLGGSGVVLILDGIDMIGAEAAGEFALNGAFSSRLASAPRTGTGPNDGPFLEIVMSVLSVGGTPKQVEVVASRFIDRRSLGR